MSEQISLDNKPEAVPDLKERIGGILLKNRYTLEELALAVKADAAEVSKALDQLIASGKNVTVTTQGIGIEKDVELNKDRITVNLGNGDILSHKFAVTADNHLASKYSRLDVLNALFDWWESEGVETVYQLGNIIDGEFRFNKFDLLAYGIEAQIDYLIENWPERKGITTKFITGDDHEGWYIQREGINVGQYIQDKAQRAGRNDLEYIGHMERNISFVNGEGSSWMRLIHAGGGSTYATSYTSQKYVESLQGGEKPNIVLVGHYHKFDYGYPREVRIIQAACTEDQTPFMRKKKIQAMVGGVLIDFKQDRHGMIHRFNVCFEPFYDRGFYKGRTWRYHWNKEGQL